MENHWIEDWLSARLESDKARKEYLSIFKTFSDFCMERGEQLQDIVKDYRAARYSGFTEQQKFLDQWNDLIKGYTTYIRPKYAPLTFKAMLSVPKSFFKFYKIPIDVQLPRHTYVLWHNRDLTKELIRKILNKASQRNRTIWLVMAESGLRAATLINVKYWQIKDDFEKGIVPMRILTPSESLKDHVGDRWSFVGEDGFKALKEYLEPRMPLQDNDFIFASENPEKVKGEQFTVSSLSTIFRKTVKALKLDKGNQPGKPRHYRMHGLRKYFRNNMRVDPAFREFWMGHSLGVDAHYVSRDPEEHRKRYAEGYDGLRILEPTTIEKKVKEQNDEIQQLKNQIEDLRKDSETFKQIVDVLRDPKKLSQFEKLISEDSGD